MELSAEGNPGHHYGLRKTRKPSTLLKDHWFVEVCVSKAEDHLSEKASVMTHAISLDHNYSSKSAGPHSVPTQHESQKDLELEDRFVKNAAVIPEFCPVLIRTQNPTPLEDTSPEQLSIHNCSTQDHQSLSHAVVDSFLKTSSGKPRPYSLKLGLRVKQRLWETLNCPMLVEEEQPDGLIRVSEIFSKTPKRSVPHIKVDISDEPFPCPPKRKKCCH